MPPSGAAIYCVLESWDTTAKEWVVESNRHESIASATGTATERGVYRVVVVNGQRRLEMDAFAIV
jgi:hypothetical protein